MQVVYFPLFPEVIALSSQYLTSHLTDTLNIGSAKRKNESVIDLLRCWSTTVDTKAIDQLDLYLNSKADKMNAELLKKLKAVSLIFNVQRIVTRFLCDIFLF